MQLSHCSYSFLAHTEERVRNNYMKNITTISSYQTVTLLKDHFNYLTFKCITISTFRLSQLCIYTYPQRRGLCRSRGQRFHIRGKRSARIIPFRYSSTDPSMKRKYGEWINKIFQNLPHQNSQMLSLKKGGLVNSVKVF